MLLCRILYRPLFLTKIVRNSHQLFKVLAMHDDEVLMNAEHKNTTDMIISESLTERELEIIDALSRGLSSDEISLKLFISVFTVNTHRRNAMDKVNARNAPHLVRICFEEGLIRNKREVLA